MSVSEAQKKATAKYERQNYDKVLLRLDKGERETIKEHAQNMGESTNEFIKRAIKITMESDKNNA